MSQARLQIMVATFLATLAMSLQAAPAEFYFPPASGTWEVVDPADHGWNRARLDELLEWAGTRGSSDVVITTGGRLLAERHFEISEPRERYARMRVGETQQGRPIEDVASVQKSVLVFLAGVARGQGLLDFDDPVSRHLGSGWSKATLEQEEKITLRHVMSMTTGLSTAAAYEVEPGTRWQYNTNVYSRLGSVLAKVFGSSVDQFTRDKLTDLIGMSDSGWKTRPWARGGADANSIGFVTSARDLARFGILTLNEGKWNDRDLLGDRTFYQDVFTPSQEHNRSYGLLWWLNGQESSLGFDGSSRSGSFTPTAPKDMVMGLGALGRKLYVVPSLGLVVTRLGDDPGPGFDREFWRRLLEAAPVKGD